VIIGSTGGRATALLSRFASGFRYTSRPRDSLIVEWSMAKSSKPPEGPTYDWRHNMSSRHSYVGPRAVILSLSAALLLGACDGNDPIAPDPTVAGVVTNSAGGNPTDGSVARIRGRVTSAATGTPVAGAIVRIGDAEATTGANGRYRLIVPAADAATLRLSAAGFADFETPIALTPGRVKHDVGLTRIEVFEFGDFALYVPAGVDEARGLMLALGGPDTRAFATAKRFGAPLPDVEASLQLLGQSLREMASVYRLAILGRRSSTPINPIVNSPETDVLLLDAVEAAAAMSGHAELPSAHLLMYGLSGGAPQASGFTARNPERVVGLFLKVPVSVSSVTSGEALGVPTYVVQAEVDAFVNNAAVATAFQANRAAGSLWALAKEPGVIHHSLTSLHRQVTINWMSTILDRRLRGARGQTLVRIAPASGWLGNLSTGEASPWATYAGDRTLASWLPSGSTAHEWETLVAPAPSP
jgi:hypothetical protein